MRLPLRADLDHVLTKQGAGQGEPMQNIVDANGRHIARLTIATSLADGDDIVRAVNSHDALVAALREAIDLVRRYGYGSDASRLEATLAQAEGVESRA